MTSSAVSNEIRRLSQYQLALASAYSVDGDGELSDYYAKDLAQISQNVIQITEDLYVL